MIDGTYPILHFKAKVATRLISVTEGIPQGGTGFDFYVQNYGSKLRCLASSWQS
jgi:hypothetical protein